MADWVDITLAVLATVGSAGGFLFGRYWKLNDLKRQKDQELIDKIKQILPNNGNTVSYLLRQHDFRGPFESDLLAPIHSLESFLNNDPESYFLNKKLKKLRINLLESIHAFLRLEANNVDVSNNNPKYFAIASEEENLKKKHFGWQNQESIPSDVEMRDARNEAWEQFENTAEELNSAATRVLDSYTNLLRKAHQQILTDTKGK
jgi:hypothetical protein